MTQDIARQKRVTKALVALGSNLPSAVGGSLQTARAAIAEIGRHSRESVEVLEASRFYRTPCFPAGSGPDYVNAAAIIGTTLTARELLDYLHEVEFRFERTRELRWGARTLDLDLLDFSGEIVPDQPGWQHWRDLPADRQRSEAPDRIILPHPRMQDRAFVLVPLAEVAADWCHPVTGLSAMTMRDSLPDEDLNAIEPLD